MSTARFPLRTKQAEFLIQDGTLEQMEFVATLARHRDAEHHAVNVARQILGEASVIQSTKHNGIWIAMDFLADEQLLLKLIRERQVTPDHEDLCLELIRASAVERFRPILERL